MISYSHWVDTPQWTTRSLLATIGSLLREHPVLVLPVLTADTLSFAAMHLQHALHAPLLGLFLNHRESVLGSPQTSFVLTVQNASKAFWLMAPLIWGCYLLTMYLYTNALVITSVQVSDAVGSKSPSFGIATLVTDHKAKIFRFSLLVFVITIIAAGAVSLLFFMSENIPWLARRIGADFGYLVGMIVELPALYVLVMPAIRLLRTTDSPIVARVHRLGAIFCFSFVILQGLLLFLINHVLPVWFFQQRTVPGLLFRQWVVSMIGASLYVPLFIALSLLASGLQPSRIDRPTAPRNEAGS